VGVDERLLRPVGAMHLPQVAHMLEPWRTCVARFSTALERLQAFGTWMGYLAFEARVAASFRIQ
jgi:hypothetical protein